MARELTTVRLLVSNIINSNKGGTEKPCTIPDLVSAFIGLKPRNHPDPSTVTAAIIA